MAKYAAAHREVDRRFGSTDFFMLLAIILWAVNFSFVKIALQEFSPLAFNGIRLVFASLCLLFFLYLSGESMRLSRPQFLLFLGLGLLGNTVYQMLFIFGIEKTTASNTAIIIASAPILISLLSALLKHEKIFKASWVGILISFIGLYLVVTNRHGGFHFSQEGIRGDVMILLGNISWAFYTVLSKPVLSRISPLKLTAWTMSMGTLVFIPFSIKDVMQTDFSRISFQAWAILVYSGLFSLGICYVIWYSSVRRVGNSKTTVYDNFIPVFTVFFAYLFLGERITPVQGLGALVIISGVYLTRSGYKWFIRKNNQG